MYKYIYMIHNYMPNYIYYIHGLFMTIYFILYIYMISLLLAIFLTIQNPANAASLSINLTQ